MERAFYKSKWKPEELDGQLVEFFLTATSHTVQGIGQFEIHTRGDLMAIDIHPINRVHPKNLFCEINDQFLADKIERGGIAAFRLIA